MLDKQYELAFPVLFPKGRYGHTAERQASISTMKYFNTRLYITVEGLPQTNWCPQISKGFFFPS